MRYLSITLLLAGLVAACFGRGALFAVLFFFAALVAAVLALSAKQKL